MLKILNGAFSSVPNKKEYSLVYDKVWQHKYSTYTCTVVWENFTTRMMRILQSQLGLINHQIFITYTIEPMKFS